mgnify:FL=1
MIRLQLPALGPVENSGGLIYFGDPTYWANSESYTSWVSYSGATLAVEPTTRPELLWAAAAGCPTRSLGVAFRCEQAGALAFDLFDAAGRQVARSDREVAAGQSGSFEVPGARGNGIYYYRVRLNPGSGRASEVTGRIVLIR